MKRRRSGPSTSEARQDIQAVDPADDASVLSMPATPEGVPASPHVENGPWQHKNIAHADERFPTRCGVCSACRQPWLRQACEAMAADSSVVRAKRQQSGSGKSRSGLDGEEPVLLQPAAYRADTAARERQLRAQALTLRQLEAPADEALLSLRRPWTPLPPVRTPQMDHDLTLRWVAAQLLMQAAQGVQHATVQHATAVDTGSGEQPPHPVQRERACSRCRIVGHTGHDCPLFNEPEQDQPPDAITQQIEAMPSELQQVLVDMQGLANVSAAEFGLLDIQQTRKNNRFVQQQFFPNALVAAGLLVDEVMKRFGWRQGRGPEPPQLLPQQPQQ